MTTMRTILHLVETSGPGGAERMLVSLVERLDPVRYRSIICLPRPGWLRTELQKRGFETVILPQRGHLDLSWVFGVLRLIRERRVSVMHAHEFAMNAYGTLLSLLTGTPLVSTVHGKNYYPERWRRRRAYRWVAKRSLMVAVSDDLKRFLCLRVGIDERQIVTLYNGVDVENPPPLNGARHALRRELTLTKGPVIGSVGNLYDVKGHRYLLEAAARVTAQVPDATFVIVGRGELLPELQQLARSLGIDKQVIFLGHRDDIAALLHLMDVFVLPSLSEGLPLSLLEAMGAARPIVATTVGGIPEVVSDGETGLLVPPRDSEALARSILLLLSDAQLAARVGQRARACVEQRFTCASMVRAYEVLYEKCVGARSWQ